MKAVSANDNVRGCDMGHELAHGEGPETDPDKTDALPILDVAGYEAQLAARGGDQPAANLPDSTWDDGRPLAHASPPAETLRDIEEWIASQNARERANERTLAELRAQRADADARSSSLAAELESVRATLQIALARANENERALLDRAATARETDARIPTLAAELEQTRAELSSTTRRLTDREAELDGARQSISTSNLAQAGQEREQAELRRAQSEGANRIALLEADLAGLRAHVDEVERELALRGESVAALAAGNDARAAAAAASEQARRAAEARSTAYLENLQSREWQRNVWEGMWRELDAELDDARTALARLERERTELAGTLETVRAELRDRNATIERLELERLAQATALRELTDGRAHDERAHQAATQELAARNAALLTDVGALEDERQQLTGSLDARASELAEARIAHAALEKALRAADAEHESHAARIAELEAIAVNIAQALQAQTAAAQNATARLEEGQRENADQQTRIRKLSAELDVAVGAAAERASAAQTAEAALTEHIVQLAANRERLAAFERDASVQAGRIAGLEAQLAKATALFEQADAPRRALEAELERVTGELGRKGGSVMSLEKQHRELALELERTRGNLEEREFRIRRLERHVATSALALGRIKVGIEKATRPADAEPGEPAEISAMLVPLEGDSNALLPLAKRATVGRAPDNDVCLNDTSVSRHHALIVVSSHGCFIEDRDSVNGVTVNGRRIRHARLADGDIITLGLRRLRFTTRAAANPDSH